MNFGIFTKGRFYLMTAIFIINVCTVKAVDPYQDTSLTFDARVNDLISRMTLAEKIQQLGNQAPAISRLGIGAYNYWSEALHGVARSGLATSFPQAIALSSTWDPGLIYNIASAISDEARVKNNTTGKGLTYWSPTINMARDPRWGRSEENYGEDTYLASQIAVNFIKGMQGNDPKYLKTVATAKHFACNNIEVNRYGISSKVDERSLREYYLQTFKECVTEGKVFSIMSAYNALNGVPCPANRTLLTNILRTEWGFNGYVVSDCDAVSNVWNAHHYVSTAPEATAISIRSGTDLNCGNTYPSNGGSAISKGLMSEEELNTTLKRMFKARFLLGEFDPLSSVPYTSIPSSQLDCQANRDLALQAGKEAIVLLKNDSAILPLNKDSIHTIAVIGPNANIVQLGGYSGSPSVSITPFQGISSKFGIGVKYALGCSIKGAIDQAAFDTAVSLAKNSDIAIVVCGTDLTVADEGTDRTSLNLPGVQEQLIKAVFHANPKTIVVLVTGFSLAVNWEQDSIPAILTAWYDGQAQGEAIADVIFGDYNPRGRLSTTWYKSVSDLPPMNDYDIKNNRTYMYFKGTPLYPFGYGLSYTAFAYSNLNINSNNLSYGDSITVSADIKNTGTVAGDEVAQMYVHVNSSVNKRPIRELKGFSSVHLQPGETGNVNFKLKHDALSYYDVQSKTFQVEDGKVDILIGASSQDIKLDTQINVTGATVVQTYRQDPFKITEAENFENKSATVRITPFSGGLCIDSLINNSYVVFKNFDFSTEAKQFNALLASTNSSGAYILIVLDSLNGQFAGELTVASTGNLNTFQIQSCLLYGVTGVRDVYLIFKSGASNTCRLDRFNFQKTIGVEVKSAKPEVEYQLSLYPNPSNSEVMIKYQLPSMSDVKIEIYSLQGILISSTIGKMQDPGVHQMKIVTDKSRLEVGTYIVRYSANDYSKSLLLNLIK